MFVGKWPSGGATIDACPYGGIGPPRRSGFHRFVSMNRGKDREVSQEEIARRRDELAKHMLNTPPQPLKPKAKAQASDKTPRPKEKDHTD